MPPGGKSLSQVTSPFSNLTSQINGIKNPRVMASTKGGQRLTVFSSRPLMALNAWAGMVLSQPGTPDDAGIGGGIKPSSSAGQRNVKVTGSFFAFAVWSCTRLFLLGAALLHFLHQHYHAACVKLKPQAIWSSHAILRAA